MFGCVDDLRTALAPDVLGEDIVPFEALDGRAWGCSLADERDAGLPTYSSSDTCTEESCADYQAVCGPHTA
jgi:hypothetical protein